jgi:hypothetical protein
MSIGYLLTRRSNSFVAAVIACMHAGTLSPVDPLSVALEF